MHFILFIPHVYFPKVSDDDLEEFDERVKEVKVKAVTAMQQFIPFVHTGEAEPSSSSETGSILQSDLFSSLSFLKTITL